MSVEDLFLAALDLPDAESRSEYLDRTCGADAALRRQVDGLLAAHFRSGEFLDVPAIGRPRLESGADNTLTIAGESAAPPEHHVEAAEELGFLTRSRRADSLGRIGHYEVLQVLGKGGFGIVFRAFDDVLQRVEGPSR